MRTEFKIIAWVVLVTGAAFGCAYFQGHPNVDNDTKKDAACVAEVLAADLVAGDTPAVVVASLAACGGNFWQTVVDIFAGKTPPGLSDEAAARARAGGHAHFLQMVPISR